MGGGVRPARAAHKRTDRSRTVFIVILSSLFSVFSLHTKSRAPGCVRVNTCCCYCLAGSPFFIAIINIKKNRLYDYLLRLQRTLCCCQFLKSKKVMDFHVTFRNCWQTRWLNVADILKYCLGCKLQYVGKWVVWQRSLPIETWITSQACFL